MGWELGDVWSKTEEHNMFSVHCHSDSVLAFSRPAKAVAGLLGDWTDWGKPCPVLASCQVMMQGQPTDVWLLRLFLVPALLPSFVEERACWTAQPWCPALRTGSPGLDPRLSSRPAAPELPQELDCSMNEWPSSDSVGTGSQTAHRDSSLEFYTLHRGLSNIMRPDTMFFQHPQEGGPVSLASITICWWDCFENPNWLWL